MDEKAKRLSRIENFFSMLLTGKGISDHIFVGDLPPTTGRSWQNMVLVDVNRQTDYGSHSSGSASIFLYARPKGTGPVKNVAMLDSMEEALDKAVKEAQDNNYVIDENWRDSGYDNDRNFHYNIVNVSVLVR